MAELVDALDSKSSSRKGVRVRPPLRAPYRFKIHFEVLSRLKALYDKENHFGATFLLFGEIDAAHFAEKFFQAFVVFLP